MIAQILSLIYLVSFSYTVKTARIDYMPNNYMYEAKVEGEYLDAVVQLERELGTERDGHRIKIRPYKKLRLDITRELGGIEYEEISIEPTIIGDLSWSAGIRTYDWDGKANLSLGLIYDSKYLDMGYKSNLMGISNFYIDSNAKIAIAILGKGFWYMPSVHFNYVNGREEYLSTQAIGYEWR